VRRQDADEFIVMTESGVSLHAAQTGAHKRFHFVAKRELQLQRVPLHEAQHARENCAIRCATWRRAWNCRRTCWSGPVAARAHARREVALHDRMPRRSSTPTAASTTTCGSQRHRPLQHPLLLLHAREGRDFVPRSEEILSFEEIERFVRVAVSLGVRKCASPAASRWCARICRPLVASWRDPGIEDVALTTNGVLLAEQAEALYEAGLRRINIHLDTLDRERFPADHPPRRTATACWRASKPPAPGLSGPSRSTRWP
jgi:hypothetical protein